MARFTDRAVLQQLGQRLIGKPVLEFALICAVSLLGWQYSRLFNRPYFSDPSGSIILVTTQDEPKVFADQVVAGAKKTREALSKGDPEKFLPPIEILQLSISRADVDSDSHLTSDGRWQIDRRLLERLAAGRVLGFISTGSSTIDHEVARIASTFRVPMLVAGATNENVLPRVPLTTVARLIGGNGSQAETIAAWMADRGPVAIVYQPTPYGTQLAGLIASRAIDHGIYAVSLPIATTVDYTALAAVQQTYGFKSFVVVAYPPVLGEILSAVTLLNDKAPVLLSDVGAVGMSSKRDAIYACMALSPTANSSGLVGFEPLGHDAYLLLESVNSIDLGSSLVEKLNNSIALHGDRFFTTELFEETGERQGTRFYISPIGDQRAK